MEYLTGNVIIDPRVNVTFSYKGQIKKGNFQILNILEEIHATGRKFLSQERISIQKKEFPVRERKFLSEEGNSCHRKNISDTERTIS